MHADRIMAWVDRRNFISVRGMVMYFTLWLTWRAFEWAATFAYSAADHPGIEVAAIVGAVTVPVTALQGYVFRKYMEAKDGSGVGA